MIHIKTILISGLLLLLFIPQISFSQNVKKSDKPRNRQSEKTVLKPVVGKKIISFKKTGNEKNNSIKRSLLLQEDFESGIFPPAGWNNFSGATIWDQAAYSYHGIGNYSAFYDNYNCNNSNNELESPAISGSVTGDTLIFDFAYAPYNDGLDDFFDDMEVFYSTDNGSSFQSLEYIPGTALQTAPGTNSPYNPGDSEWSTYYIILPADGITNIKFKSWENCSNLLYLDNIKISQGPVDPVTDIAVSTAYSMGRYPRTFLTNDSIGANLRNTGNQTVTNLVVHMQMTGANTLSDSIVVASITGGTDRVIKFRPFTPIINGNSVVKVWIAHGDENPANDSALYNTNVNSNYFAYTDTVWTGSYGAIGFLDGTYIIQKYRVTNANSRITEIKLRIPADVTNAIGQIIKGVILDASGVIAAKSDAYRIKSSDIGTFVTLKITDPLPYYPLTNNSYFYAGGEYSEPVGDELFWDISNQEEDPPRPDTYFWGFGGIKSPGESVYLYNAGGKYGIEVKIETMPAVDAGVSNQGNLFEQYYTSATAPMTGKVFNNALTGTANATVIRKITPGTYTSSVPVSIPANSSLNVTYANFTFTSGTVYTVRDSIVLTGDVNSANNVLVNNYTPRIAKDLVFMYQKDEDKDSLIRAINADFRYVNNWDSININYTGSYRPWKIMFALPKSQRDFLPRVRDSLKSFMDASTPVNKKTLVVFGDRTVKGSDPSSGEFTGIAADSVFLRQYLRSGYVGENWLVNIPASNRKFKGSGFFNGITQDSVGDPWYTTAALIKPMNGGLPAFIPSSVTGSGNDSSVAVSYAGTNYNSFFMSNRFSDLRATTVSGRGPVMVYTKIIDWIQNIMSNVKVLDLTAKIEGFYNPVTNSMVSDTVKVYLRGSVTPYVKIDSAKGYLNSGGTASFVFNNASNGVGYYINVKHRNGVQTWSKIPQSFSSNHLAYNFTTDSARSFANNLKKQGTSWVIFGGDANQDGIVNLTDLISVFNNASLFTTGYVTTDMNGDNIVNLTDIVLTFNNSALFVKSKTPLTGALIAGNNYNTENVQSFGPQTEENYNNIDNNFNTGNQIYELTKHQLRNQSNTGDHMIFEKGKGTRLIKGMNKSR